MQFPPYAAKYAVSADARASAPPTVAARTSQEVVLSRGMRRGEGIRIAANTIQIYLHQLSLGPILLFVFEQIQTALCTVDLDGAVVIRIPQAAQRPAETQRDLQGEGSSTVT